MVITQAVILVGGKGTRLNKTVSDRPKPMAEVAGRPFIEWVLLAIREQGIRRIVLGTGFKGDMISGYFGDGSRLGLNIEYAQEHEPLGTAGALRHAWKLTAARTLLVMNGDSYCPFDLKRFAEAHAKAEARATLWLVRAEDVSRYGSVEIAGDGSVKAFYEKSSAQRCGLISAGMYLLDRDVIATVPEGTMVSLEKEVLPKLIGKGLYAIAGQGPFVDIGTPESYTLASTVLAEELKHLATILAESARLRHAKEREPTHGIC